MRLFASLAAARLGLVRRLVGSSGSKNRVGNWQSSNSTHLAAVGPAAARTAAAPADADTTAVASAAVPALAAGVAGSCPAAACLTAGRCGSQLPCTPRAAVPAVECADRWRPGRQRAVTAGVAMEGLSTVRAAAGAVAAPLRLAVAAEGTAASCAGAAAAVAVAEV